MGPFIAQDWPDYAEAVRLLFILKVIDNDV